MKAGAVTYGYVIVLCDDRMLSDGTAEETSLLRQRNRKWRYGAKSFQRNGQSMSEVFLGYDALSLGE
jgi:hypothetical protein